MSTTESAVKPVTIGQQINALPAGPFKTLTKVQPSGSLQARKGATGAVNFFWRYTIGAKSERVQIGLYDPAAPPKSLSPTPKGYSYAAAVRAAEAMASEHFQHRAEGGRPAMQAAKALAREAKARETQRDAKCTLGALLDHYADYLESRGKPSHGDARSIFTLHVKQAWPGFASLPAKQISSDQVAEMMGRLHDEGKGRTANKLRSYLRAAFATARSAKSTPSIPKHFKEYEIAQNPAADTMPDPSMNRPDKNPLSVHEMRLYWAKIRTLEGLKGAVLRLHLLTGAQRIEQLVRLQTSNIKENSILIHDTKGRSSLARDHVVPLTDLAKLALRECAPTGKYALSTDGGKTHIAATTLSKWAKDAANDIDGFRTKRLRSGVETALAAGKVNKEVRGRLQSHGVSGVQARSYDSHEYLDEKMDALKKLEKIVL